jgi:polysaccharide deacetylase 2 family uncharacterized protein YibQ
LQLARKNRFKNPRAKKGGKKGGKVVLVILLIISLIGGYLAVTTYQDKKRREVERERYKKPLSAERHQIPDKKKKIAPLQEMYTAAVIPYTPSEKPKMKPLLKAGSLAIVIDDMGASLQELNSLTSLNVPLTFSVIPQLPHATEVATTAHGKGYEVIVHLPMEPKGYPQRRLEQNGLLLRLSDEEIDRQVRRYLDLVPYAAGANNHMGSRFTEDSAKMLPVMQVLKQKRLYFLDSKTTPLSVGYSLAHELGMKSGFRNVFLDNVQEVGAIRTQLQQAAQIARKRGYAIAICHPHKTTIEALTRILPELKAEGITFVKLSQVVE